MGLKGNQTNLHDDVKSYFDDLLKSENSYEKPQKTMTNEKGHGRIEKREYYLTTDINWLSQKSDWRNFNAIGMVKSTVFEKELSRVETRFFITSLTDVKKFANSTREHWGIENSLHWCLDVGFNEDNCRMRKDNSGEKFAVIRHIAMNLLKQDNSKMSIKGKRHRCAYDDAFLYHIIFDLGRK